MNTYRKSNVPYYFLASNLNEMYYQGEDKELMLFNQTIKLIVNPNPIMNKLADKK